MARGSKPGERRGGREKGTPNKATREIKEIARQYGPDAIEALAKLGGLKGEGAAESEQARISALNIVIERGYGKATQTIAGDADNPLQTHQVIEQRIVDPKG